MGWSDRLSSLTSGRSSTIALAIRRNFARGSVIECFGTDDMMRKLSLNARGRFVGPEISTVLWPHHNVFLRNVKII